MFEKYLSYAADDFASDEFFRRWILDKAPEADRFWLQWIELHPEKRQDILEAIALLKTFGISEASLSTPQIERAISQTLERIESGSHNRPVGPFAFLRRPVRYAAVVMLLVLIGWATGRISVKKDGIAMINASGANDWLELENRLGNPREAKLPDGSIVVLDPNSTLRYRNEKTGERVVMLTGGAFFDVVRNPDRPFRVVTSDLITQVLGTSFRVSSDNVLRESKVRVMTGKVEVSVRSKTKGRGNNTILYPNQEMVYTEPQNKITKAIVPDPVEIKKPESKEVIYEEAPIGRIFDELEVLYGVSIDYNKELLANCSITASFTNETFWEKLNLICRPVRATIKEKDGEIFIESAGCKF